MRRVLLVLSVASLLAVAAPSHAIEAATISIVDFAFNPAATVTDLSPVGFSGHFTNDGGTFHTATADGGMFATGQIAAGDDAIVQLVGAGTYRFTCANHAQMTGKIALRPVIGDPTPKLGDRVPLHLGATGATGVMFDVQMKIGSKPWTTIATDRTAVTKSITFRKLRTYRFRVRTQDAVTLVDGSAWSPIETAKVHG